MSTYRVLVVCTGNICRSPFAERLLRARLDERFGAAAQSIEISSAGTYGLVGEPMMPEAAETLIRYGGRPDEFASCAVDRERIEAADLVLGLAREHRGAIVTMLPRASAKTVTVREYARLLTGVVPADLAGSGPELADRFRAMTTLAFGRRGFAPPKDPSDDDVPDPFGGPMAAYERAAVMIHEALEVPLSLLAG
ncbi:MAG TPA: protein tyrosine phosphatase [Mycobacteriales bacterium]|nr:protein tyrosine phosphatase [Mycobacteriales bacterium]